MKTTKKIPVLITAVSGASSGMQILKALKLSDLPYYFVGTDISRNSYGFSLVDKGYFVPLASDPEYIDTLVDICKKEKIKVLLCGSDPELLTISRNRKVFKDMGIILPINSPDLIYLCMNKYETMRFLKREDFNVPRTFLVSSIDDIDTVDVYPVVCKPYINSGGSNNVFIAQNNKELRLITEYLLTFLKAFIVQEYIGTANSEYTTGVLVDLEGVVMGSIGIKRDILSGLSNRIKVINATGRKELGEKLAISSGISQGEIGKFREVTEYCEKIARFIGAKAPLNFQCRVFNNKVYIFEINPRFSGTTSLRAKAGFNEPDILIRKYVLGETIGNISYKEGIMMRCLEENFVEAL